MDGNLGDVDDKVDDNDEDCGYDTIGGIPLKFLDLSHFPLLRRLFPQKKGGGILRGGGH
jgi:hypothetical protein